MAKLCFRDLWKNNLTYCCWIYNCLESRAMNCVPVILKKYPEISILALTNYNSALYITTMFRQGALGYLLGRQRSSIPLIEAIETVYRKETFTEPSLKEKAAKENGQHNKNIYARLSLTMMEKEIIHLLAAGKSNQEIADALFIGYNTVRNYRVRILPSWKSIPSVSW